MGKIVGGWFVCLCSGHRFTLLLFVMPDNKIGIVIIIIVKENKKNRDEKNNTTQRELDLSGLDLEFDVSFCVWNRERRESDQLAGDCDA